MTGSSNDDSLEGLEERRKQLEQLSRPLLHLLPHVRRLQRELSEVVVESDVWLDRRGWEQVTRRLSMDVHEQAFGCDHDRRSRLPPVDREALLAVFSCAP
jgi:hypothetical protein